MSAVLPFTQPALLKTSLRVHQLHWHFDRRCVLHNIGFSLPTGSMIAVLGANGAGKTTLLRLLSGELLPMQGEVTRQGRSVFLPQHSLADRAFPVTVAEIVAMADRSPFWHWRARRARVGAALAAMDLTALATAPLARLSAGQFKRALLARALIEDADILCLDEPFAEIDEKTALRILLHLRNLAKSGKTIIVSLHNAALAGQFFDLALLLDGGGAQLGAVSNIVPLYKTNNGLR